MYHALIDAGRQVIGVSLAGAYDAVPDGLTQIEIEARPYPGQTIAADGAITDAELTASGLARYAEQKHALVLNGGLSVEASAGKRIDVASNAQGRGLVDGCVGLVNLAKQLGEPEPTFPWVNNDGSSVTLSAAEIFVVALALGQFVQATYRVLGEAGAGIGGGAITGKAGVDGLPWPANS